MNPEAEHLMEELDAALFSGDCFYSPEAVIALRENLARWARKVEEIAEIINS